MRAKLNLLQYVFVLIGLLGIVPVQAAQQLVPTPYPEVLGPNAQIGGGAPRAHRHRHQHLIPDPVFRKASAPMRSAIRRPRTAIGISIFCGRPIGGNIINGGKASGSTSFCDAGFAFAAAGQRRALALDPEFGSAVGVAAAIRR